MNSKNDPRLRFPPKVRGRNGSVEVKNTTSAYCNYNGKISKNFKNLPENVIWEIYNVDFDNEKFEAVYFFNVFLFVFYLFFYIFSYNLKNISDAILSQNHFKF